MRRQTSWKLSSMKQDEKFADVNWKMLNEYLPDKLLEELDEENNTDFHRQLSTQINENLPIQTGRSLPTEFQLQTIPTVYQTDSLLSSPITRRKTSRTDDIVLPIIHIRHIHDDEHKKNIRDELIVRFLTAMSIDYEKQWYLGMIRRKTLNILMKSVEQGKEKCSLETHWKLILQHFRLSIFLRLLMNSQYFHFINQWTNRLVFDHIFRTIELTLSKSKTLVRIFNSLLRSGFHSAKTRMDNIRLQFPELSNLDEQIMNEVYEEVKMYQTNAVHILLDLQQSYRLCWTVQMTRRCAQMLLKYESVAIIQLYETGMLEENEYAHILELIEKKLYFLEYGNIQMPKGQVKILEDPFGLIPYFQSLPIKDQIRWKMYFNSHHQWFQPGTILLEKNQRVVTAYLIVRGIVQYKDDRTPTYYKCGTIIGIDALFTRKSLTYGTYAATSGLVEAYAIDSTLLGLLLNDEQISRSIYDEIALHLIMNNYQKSFLLNHSQLKMLLDEKSRFYYRPSNVNIHLQPGERLFLLSGTITDRTNEQQESILNSIHFVSYDVEKDFQFNASSIAYVWTHEDEIHYFNLRKYKLNFANENNEIHEMEPFYPFYLGESVEFSPHRHSSSMTRPVENTSNLQMIPSEMEVTNELTVPPPSF